MPEAASRRPMREVPGDRFKADELPAGLVAVLFCADWCGYCHRFLPHFRKLPDGIAVDISDEDHPLWDAYAIRVVPTVVLFKDRVPVRQWAGVLAAHHADQIREALKAP